MDIDYNKLGMAFLECLDKEDLAILSIGMIPHKKFKIFMDEFFDIYSEKYTKEGKYITKNDVKKVLNKKWKSEQEHKISCAIYSNVRMMV